MAELASGLAAGGWPEFLLRVKAARAELRNPKVVWYRGHAKSSYSLLPSLFRNIDWVGHESSLFNEYERFSQNLVGVDKNDWEILQDMQHYGIPTRLLDWTDVLGIAVAFALLEAPDDADDAAVYVLDPVRLNNASGVSGVKRASTDPDFRYKSIYWEGKPFAPVLPIAIDGRLHSQRLMAQRGNFTVQGRGREPLDSQVPDVVIKVQLPASAKSDARDFLEDANLNPFTIYPDMFGVARYLRRRHLSA